METIDIGGITIHDPISVRRLISHTSFIGPLEDMPFFTPYLASFVPLIQEWLENNQMPPLTTIHAIRYVDKYMPQRFLNMWIAYSDDKTVGWYKYAGLVAGGTQHKLIYEGGYHRVPTRRLTYPRRRRVVNVD